MLIRGHHWTPISVLPGFSRNENLPKEGRNLQKQGSSKTSLQLKMMHFFLVKRFFFFRFLDIESSSNSLGIYPKLPTSTLAKQSDLYGTGEMEKSRRKNVKNM